MHTRPNISTVVWRTAADLTTKRYVFESCYRPYVVWVGLDKLDFTAGSPSRRLDVTGEEWLVGDVSQQFTERSTVLFLPVTPAAQPAS